MFVYPNVFNIKIINQDFVLDGIDKEILLHLTENERTPILEIARSMGGGRVHGSINEIANWKTLVSFREVMSKSMRKNLAIQLMPSLASISTMPLTIAKQWQSSTKFPRLPPVTTPLVVGVC